MAQSTPERDWKSMKKIRDDLLNSLCDRINKQSLAILKQEGDDNSPYERYLQLYAHIRESNRIVADCFDDWRRSTLLIKMAHLQHQGLLTQEQFARLSEETQQKLVGLSKL